MNNIILIYKNNYLTNTLLTGKGNEFCESAIKYSRILHLKIGSEFFGRKVVHRKKNATFLKYNKSILCLIEHT